MGIYRGAGGTGDAVNDASSEATLVQSLISGATTQANNAAASATAAQAASTQAAISQGLAADSATAAATAETNAETAETNAETAETNAETAQAAAEAAQAAAETAQTAAELAETNAETAETNAETAATNAASSASAASTSATNASNSATAAAGSASTASAASAAALTALDSFDDRYLGSKSTAPTLDNDGNALMSGALYFDTVSNSMKVYTGSVWIDAYADGATFLAKASNLSDLTNTATARTNLGVAIGTNVQAYDAQLADVAGLTPSDNNFIVGNGTNFVTESGATARTSLGLGSISTQDSSNVAITGGAINGTTIGASTASTGRFSDLTNTGLTATRVTYAGTGGNLVDSANLTFDGTTLTAAGLTDSGNLTFTGTGNRIRGDFSNATVANRVMFQTSGTNSNTFVGFLPSGTAVRSDLSLYSSSDTINSSFLAMQMRSGTAIAVIESGITGTGTFLPLLMHTGGSERLRIDTSGNVGIGNTVASTINAQSDYANLVVGNGSGTEGITVYTGTSSEGALAFADGTSSTDTYRGLIAYNHANNSMAFRTDATERMRITSAGNVGIGNTSPSTLLTVGSGGNLGSLTTPSLRLQGFDVLFGSYGGMIFNSTNGQTSSARRFMVTNALDSTKFAIIRSTDATTDPALTNSGVISSGTADFVIDNAGNVGIGTSSPAANNKLHVSSAGTTRLYVENTANAVGVRLQTLSNVGLLQTDTNHPLTFATNNGAEAMRIDTSGNVGIGTSSPSSLLDVRGVSGSTKIKAFETTTSGRIELEANTAYHAIYCDRAVPLLFYTNGSERMRIDSSGNLCLGTTSAGARLSIAFSSNSGPCIISNDTTPQNGNTFHQFRNNGTTCGSITSNGTTTTTYGTGSDYRLKENIAPMTGALAKVTQLKPCTYTWKIDGSKGQGFIAHELQEVVPDAVVGEKDAVDDKNEPKHQMVDTSFLVATLTAAIQEQQAIIENLTARLNALEGN
jgi:hypothetical protein